MEQQRHTLDERLDAAMKQVSAPNLRDRDQIFMHPSQETQERINELGLRLAWDLCLDPATDMAQATPRTFEDVATQLWKDITGT